LHKKKSRKRGEGQTKRKHHPGKISPKTGQISTGEGIKQVARLDQAREKKKKKTARWGGHENRKKTRLKGRTEKNAGSASRIRPEKRRVHRPVRTRDYRKKNHSKYSGGGTECGQNLGFRGKRHQLGASRTRYGGKGVICCAYEGALRRSNGGREGKTDTDVNRGGGKGGVGNYLG